MNENPYNPMVHLTDRKLDDTDKTFFNVLSRIAGGTIVGMVRSEPGAPEWEEYYGLTIKRPDGAIQHLLFWSDGEHNSPGLPELTHIFSMAEDKSLWEHYQANGMDQTSLVRWCKTNKVFYKDAKSELDQLIDSALGGVPGWA